MLALLKRGMLIPAVPSTLGLAELLVLEDFMEQHKQDIKRKITMALDITEMITTIFTLIELSILMESENWFLNSFCWLRSKLMTGIKLLFNQLLVK